jgi:hypothetical protein
MQYRIRPGGGRVMLTETTPLTVYGADLHQWLRGDNVTLNGGVTVSTWQDLSGKGNDGIQGTGSAQPAYAALDATLDNQPTATGDGANDVLTTAGLTTDLATNDFYVSAILKQVTWAGASDALSSGSGVTIPRFIQLTSTPGMRASAASNGANNNGAPVGTWVRGEVLWSATPGVSYSKLGSSVAAGDVGLTGTRTGSALFGWTASGFGNFALAEFIVVKRAAGSGGPTGPERDAIDGYLQGRYPSASF